MALAGKPLASGGKWADDAVMTATSELTDLLATLYASFASGDPSAWTTALAPDALVIGTDQAEWWQGKDTLVRVLTAQISEMSNAGIRVSGAEPHVVADGDFIWAADRPVLHLADGTDVPLRLTLLVRRDGTQLLMQHVHVSVGTPNEETVQQQLTV